MQSTQLGVKPLANDLTVPDHNRTNEGIRTNSTAPALSKLKRPAQMGLIHGCELGIHRLIDWSVNQWYRARH
jgi:hypothetical protein